MVISAYFITGRYITHSYQLLDEVEQNIVSCQWHADQLRSISARHWQITILWTTEFNYCFITHLHNFVLCFLLFFLFNSGRHCIFTKIEGNAENIICS